MATISTNKNEATITFAPGAAKGMTVLVKTNSSTEQHIQLNIDGTETSVVGSGERNTILKSIPLDPSVSKVTATFSYDDKSARKPSAGLNSGGPYAIGAYRTMVIVAENGDDADYNDAIVEINGYAPR
jgi:hypothetical protein